MSARINTNGQARKSLADQIDRLDGMLDGLSDGLNEAVAEAVRNAVGAAVHQAVQTVLRDVLTNPEMVARFEAATPAEAEPVAATPPQATKIGWQERWASVRKTLMAWALPARIECGRRLGQARRCLTVAWDCVRFLSRVPYLLLTAAVVGVTAGIAACVTRPWWSAAVGAVGGLAATMALQIQSVWRRLTTLYAASIA